MLDMSFRWLSAWHIRDETYSKALAQNRQLSPSSAIRSPLGRRHHVFFRRTTIPGGCDIPNGTIVMAEND
jgi:hypothetical protein